MSSPKDSGAELWREVTRTVRPLSRRAEPPPARLQARPAPVAPRMVLPAHPPPPARSHAPLADRSPEKRVRRGRVDIGGRLDLHGMTQAAAQAALGRFLAHHCSEGARCVLVVTGKGGRAGAGEGVLKRQLPAWLEGHRAIVSGYAAAHRNHGGAGAYYVFLRSTG
jgi:DNA-nicking Smr family endonuclease